MLTDPEPSSVLVGSIRPRYWFVFRACREAGCILVCSGTVQIGPRLPSVPARRQHAGSPALSCFGVTWMIVGLCQWSNITDSRATLRVDIEFYRGTILWAYQSKVLVWDPCPFGLITRNIDSSSYTGFHVGPQRHFVRFVQCASCFFNRWLWRLA